MLTTSIAGQFYCLWLRKRSPLMWGLEISNRSPNAKVCFYLWSKSCRTHIQLQLYVYRMNSYTQQQCQLLTYATWRYLWVYRGEYVVSLVQNGSSIVEPRSLPSDISLQPSEAIPTRVTADSALIHATGSDIAIPPKVRATITFAEFPNIWLLAWFFSLEVIMLNSLIWQLSEVWASGCLWLLAWFENGKCNAATRTPSVDFNGAVILYAECD